MTPPEKVNLVVRLCAELQDEENSAIVHGRIEALAKELAVSPHQCALVYWALKNADEFRIMFGGDVKMRFSSK